MYNNLSFTCSNCVCGRCIYRCQYCGGCKSGDRATGICIKIETLDEWSDDND